MLFVIVLPLPNRLRKFMYQGWHQIMSNHQSRTVVWILMALVALLFVDSWKRANVRVIKQAETGPQDGYDAAPPVSTQALATKAYNQRNVYISGFILYFWGGIATVMSLLRRFIKYDDLLEQQKKGPNAANERAAELRKVLESRNRDLEVLRKQVKNAEAHYDSQIGEGKRAADKKKD